MKTVLLVFSVIFCVATSPIHAQVSNLYVNGSQGYFSITSGDFFSWSFDLPVGGTADIEVWIDVDGDSAIDPGTDRILQFLQQIDGVVSDEGGVVPDFDFIEDGSIHFGMAIGLAPARYLMQVTNNGSGTTIGGIVLPLAAPAFTISGTVSGPPGADLSYILIDVSREDTLSPNFWNALTDGSGNYTVQMNDDTAGNPWWIGVDNAPRPYLVSPRETTLTITGNHVGVNFDLVRAAAHVSGVILDESGDTLRNRLISMDRIDPGWTSVMHWTISDWRGSFWVGVPLSELNGNPWWLVQPYFYDEPTTTHMMGMRLVSPFADGDSLVRNLTVYQTNSTVRGRVLLNGLPPGFDIMMFAQNDDTARAWARSDQFTGEFSIPVSDRISHYVLRPYNLMGSFSFPTVSVAAGDTGVVFNILTVGVDGSGDEMPREYSLEQNYPNPFNPVTTIEYTLPQRVQVNVAVFDLLGREVATLVDETQDPGFKTVSFDAGNLPSGIYICRVSAGVFSDMKKMLLLR